MESKTVDKPETLAEMMGWTLLDKSRPHIKYFPDIVQHTDEWLQARCGLLTASETKLIITPTLKTASNEKERAHLYELAAQRINQYVEPSFQSYDMQRGVLDESDATQLYNKKYNPLQSMGFITNERHGFKLGYSPDGLTVDGAGQVEAKSRKQKFQLETIVTGKLPDEYSIQIQTGLVVSERQWCDFISWSGGMPMFVLRIYPDPVIQEAIINVAGGFHDRLHKAITEYHERVAAGKFHPTERRKEEIQA